MGKARDLANAESRFVNAAGDTITGDVGILKNASSPSLVLQRSNNTSSTNDFVQGIRFANSTGDWNAEISAYQGTIYPDAIGLQFTTMNGTGGRAANMKLDNNGNLRFNSGYGSAATAYGCRAWINMSMSANTIRGSGGISSITQVTSSRYRCNFSSAMPDTNYAVVSNASDNVQQANPYPLGLNTAWFGLCGFRSDTGGDLSWNEAYAAVFR